VTFAITTCAFVVLGQFERRHYDRLRENDQKRCLFEQTSDGLYLLQQIRGGETNRAIDYLEGRVTMNLVQFWVYDKQDPTAQSGLANLMSEVGNYRAKYPNSRSTFATMLWNGKTLNASQAVAEVLSWTNGTVGK